MMRTVIRMSKQGGMASSDDVGRCSRPRRYIWVDILERQNIWTLIAIEVNDLISRVGHHLRHLLSVCGCSLWSRSLATLNATAVLSNFVTLAALGNDL